MDNSNIKKQITKLQIPFLYDEVDSVETESYVEEGLIPLTDIYKRVEKKLKTPQGKIGEYLQPGTVLGE